MPALSAKGPFASIKSGAPEMSALLGKVLIAALEGLALRVLLEQPRPQAQGDVALGPGGRLRCNGPAQRRACQAAACSTSYWPAFAPVDCRHMRPPHAGASLHSWRTSAYGCWQALGITLQRLWLYLPCKTLCSSKT